MKLKDLNENHQEDELFDNSLNKYVKARGQGNINKKQSENNPDKTEQPDRSGNQSAAATNDENAKKLLGISGNGRDKQRPTNLASNPSPTI